MKRYKKYIILFVLLGFVMIIYYLPKYKCSSDITTIQEIRSSNGDYTAVQDIETRKCGSKNITNTIIKITDDESRTQNVYTAYGGSFEQTTYKDIPFLFWKIINSQESLLICQPEKNITNTAEEISFPSRTKVPVIIESPDFGPWVHCFEYYNDREKLSGVETNSAGEAWPKDWIKWQVVYQGELVTMIGPAKSLDNFIIVLQKKYERKIFS